MRVFAILVYAGAMLWLPVAVYQAIDVQLSIERANARPHLAALSRR